MRHDAFCRCPACKPSYPILQAERDAQTLARLKVALIIASVLLLLLIVARAI